MVDYKSILQKEITLDPENWEAHKALAHQMVDDMYDYLSKVDEQKAWMKTPSSTIDKLTEDLQSNGESLTNIYQEFKANILPYRKGNIHPRYFSWVEGTGTITGVLADMLASTMNSNNAIGDHSAMYVERQVLNWCKEIVGYPKDASGVLVSGGSIANVTGLVVARNNFMEGIIKKSGLVNFGKQLIVYCSEETHNCIFKAVETIGIGSLFLRKIAVNANFEIDIEVLGSAIREDRESGLLPFCIVGNAGTVNTGAIDPLEKLANICKEEGMWFHVDGAIGAVVNLVPEYAEKMKGLQMADSIAFDLHKWMYINYEAGCILIKDQVANKNAFIQEAKYLAKHERGLASGPETYSNYGLDLSKSFKSLKIWMNIREHGIDKYRNCIRQNIALAFYMESVISMEENLEMLTPVTLNIVCYRYNPGGLNIDQLNNLNQELLMRMQESGIAAPSYTVVHHQYAIRLSITNHRTKVSDIDSVIEASKELGASLSQSKEYVK
ncbi:MAG: aspartate aminotransferase family protein [Ginsengibacter sp.]